MLHILLEIVDRLSIFSLFFISTGNLLDSLPLLYRHFARYRDSWAKPMAKSSAMWWLTGLLWFVKVPTLMLLQGTINNPLLCCCFLKNQNQYFSGRCLPIYYESSRLVFICFTGYYLKPNTTDCLLLIARVNWWVFLTFLPSSVPLPFQ